MWKLLLLLLVGTVCAQESGDHDQENNRMIKVSDKFHESIEEYNDEKGSWGEDLSLGQDSDHIKPNFTVENAACADKGKCVYQLFTTSNCYNDAEKVCRNWSGHLTSIHSFRENSVVQGYLMRYIRNSSYVWIGIWKPNACRPYQNIDGSKWNYSNWESRQQRSSGHWCVAMDISNGMWYSFHCRTRLSFVCTY
ncbi:bone marrow proteoglycan-like [Phyllobates terribilis]|uniref:bone marrow proteoglycan-like n=1 Tax=Phyllobates terribilis TaxID=111132 RepID=UPI003CCB642E